jgi:methenyltetrahydromethanopterin cyclohydrolase
MPTGLNARAAGIVAAGLADADRLGVVGHRTDAGVQIVDAGVKAAGGDEAGLLLAHAALAGLGEVWLEACGTPPHHNRIHPASDPWDGRCPWPIVAVESEAPIAACLASQYAGWKVSEGKYFAMASGPLRAAIGREDLYDDIGLRERADVAVGLLESSKLPPEDVCLRLATEAGVSPDQLLLLVARTASRAGTLQVVARSLETALHKLHDLHFDLGRIRAGLGRAPLPPVPSPPDDLEAIGRTNDAILYGGQVVLEVTGPDAGLDDVAAAMVSGASASHGRPFRALFEEAGYDFYKLDPALFAPAVVELVNIDTGVRHRAGSIMADVVRMSFGGA